MEPEPITRLLSPRQVADVLAKSDSWVRKNAEAFGGVRVGEEWRFQPQLVVEGLIRMHPDQNPDHYRELLPAFNGE